MEPLQNKVRVFSKTTASLLNANSSIDYAVELSRYIRELTSLQRRISNRSALLSSSSDRINTISSSNDPNLLQSVLKLKLALLLERKNRLYESICSVKSSLTSQKSSLLGMTSSNLSPSQVNSAIACLKTVQHELNHKILSHYTAYNVVLSEIEGLVKDPCISKKDKKTIFSILFPTYPRDKYPLLTKACRKLFGSRVSTGAQFIHDLFTKSMSHEIRLSSESDSFEIVSCFVHFIMNHLLVSSSFSFGLVCTMCIILWKTLSVVHLSSSIFLQGLSMIVLSTVLFVWASFNMFVCFFPWTLGTLSFSPPSIGFNSLLNRLSISPTRLEPSPSSLSTSFSGGHADGLRQPSRIEGVSISPTFSSAPSECSLFEHVAPFDSSIIGLYPLFTANIVSSMLFCVLAVSLVDYLLYTLLPSYSKIVFLAVCISASLFSSLLSSAKSFRGFKSSRESSSTRLLFFSMLILSVSFMFTVLSIGVHEVCFRTSF